MKIGFQFYSGSGWLAGQTTAVNMFSALRCLGAEAPELALVAWSGLGPQDYSSLLPLVKEVITVPNRPPPPAARPSLPRRLIQRLRGAPRGRPAAAPLTAAEIMRQHGVDCLFATPQQHRPALGLPVLFWLPDLQHMHLPEITPPAERAHRDTLYHRELEAATLVLVTAETVRQDLIKYAPSQAGKVRVVPIVAAVPEAVYTADPQPLAQSYHLPERYFWLPSHFWQHKNHRAVLAALRLLQSRSVYPRVVCTGNVSDHRNPEHVAGLLRTVSQWNLRDQFILLGLLPYPEVLALMRQALCLLSASLFEGYGLTVAESHSIGKRALLSDLPAHREQNPPGAVYFDPTNAQDLADKLQAIWETGRAGPDLELEAAARAALPERQAAFGRALLRVARETAEAGKLQNS